MTDTPPEVEAGRAIAAAWDALNSPEHKADVETLRDVSKRVSSRTDAFQAAQDRIHGLRTAACANGTPAADNTQAAQVIDPKREWASQFLTDAHNHGVVDLTDLTASYADDDDVDEDASARRSGALEN